MAGSIFDDINPNTTSGTDLSTLLNNFKDAFASSIKQSTRPNNIQDGGLWIDDSLEISDDILRLMLFASATDIEVLRINKTSQSITVGSVDGFLDILRNSDDAFGADLNMLKRRKTGAAKTRDGDEVGNINFKGVDDAVVDYVVAKIKAIATEDYTAANQGSELAFSTTVTGSAALVERLRIKNSGQIGMGTQDPEADLHIKKQSSSAIEVEQETDDALGPEVKIKKARISGNGQTLNGDSLGTVSYYGEEVDGTEAILAKIEAFADEDTTSASHGSKLVISTKNKTTNVFEEKIVIDSDGVSLDGQVQDDTKETIAMAHAGLTQPLFTVDSSVHEAFTAEFYATGISTDTRSTRYVMECVWDGTAWQYEIDTKGLAGADKVIDPVVTNAAIFTCEYDNLLDQGNFVSGKIFLKITKHGA